MRKLYVSIFFLLMSITLHAQQTGSIVGTVKDPSGAAVPDANITFVNPSTQLQRVVTSNGQGEYVASALPTGQYSVTVEKTGFRKLERSGLTLTTANTITVDLDLQVGSEM